MLTRRQTLRVLGAAGVAVPLLDACGTTTPRQTEGGGGGVRLVAADVDRSVGDPAAVAGVVSAMDAFTGDLWRVIGAGQANLALSPYSIAVALAMTANGAAGSTSTSMRSVLHIESLASFNAGLASLTQEVAGLAGPVRVDGKAQEILLAPANQLFGEQTFAWRSAFLTVLAKMYGAGMRTVDFVHEPDRCRALINAWTASQTHDRIPTILPPGSIDDRTRLVLVNALYFKAPWQTPFDQDSTSRGPFHRADGSTVTAELMSIEEGSTYVAGTHYQGARLPYAGGRLAMTLALPDPGAEQAALDELLTSLRRPGDDGLRLTVPRWTYRVATDLKQPLESLGMAVAFGDAADFSAMTDTASLAIHDVFHQTFVAVDEAGTEAAAATAVVMTPTAGMVTRHELVLDRPFLFVIHDTAHGTPLFVGRVADPTSAT
jgi:serpin B